MFREEDVDAHIIGTNTDEAHQNPGAYTDHGVIEDRDSTERNAQGPPIKWVGAPRDGFAI